MNLRTGKSQWDPPTAPAQSEEHHSPPPPPYNHSGYADQAAVGNAGDIKRPLSSNNPYGSKSSSPSVGDDARLAAQLQAEENARAGGKSPAGASRGAAAEFYNDSPQGQGQGYPPSSQGPPPAASVPQDQGKSRGFLGKFLGKNSSSQGGGYAARPPPQQYGYQGYPPQGGYRGGYPPPQPGYGYPPQGGYYPQQQYAPPKKSGMSNGAAAALGVGGGLLGGALLADAFEDHDQNEYDQGYDNGYDDGGGDFGGDF